MVVGRQVEKVRQITRQKQGMVCRRLVRDWVVRPQASVENDSWRISKRTKEHNAEKFRNLFGDVQFAEPPSFPFLLGSVDEGLETSKRRLAAGVSESSKKRDPVPRFRRPTSAPVADLQRPMSRSPADDALHLDSPRHGPIEDRLGSLS